MGGLEYGNKDVLKNFFMIANISLDENHLKIKDGPVILKERFQAQFHKEIMKRVQRLWMYFLRNFLPELITYSSNEEFWIMFAHHFRSDTTSTEFKPIPEKGFKLQASQLKKYS